METICNIAHQIQAGYPGIQHSGKVTSCAPPFAASSISLHVFVTHLERSSHSGSAWVTATRTAVGGISLDDIVLSDNVAARNRARNFSCKVLAFIKVDHNPLAPATQIPKIMRGMAGSTRRLSTLRNGIPHLGPYVAICGWRHGSGKHNWGAFRERLQFGCCLGTPLNHLCCDYYRYW